MPAYQLTFDNQSTLDWTAAVYQQDPNIGNPNVMSLAWFAKRAFKGTQVTFTWDIDYCFAWSETGALNPGVIFNATQTVAGNLDTQNLVTLDYDPASGGAYHFLLPVSSGPNNGTMYINCTNHVPAINQVSVGIGMSGFGTFAVQGTTSLHAMFTPHPKYYIVFGQFTQGEVLDITEIAGSSTAVVFPAGVYHMKATLDSSNSWTVVPA